MRKPLMFDLFCGLGGATEGFLAEGWDCIGVDIERHQYGAYRYPAQLWIQNILTISGAQLRDADFLWASPPCQFFSYTAMPWSKAKALAAEVRTDPERLAQETALFDACFRIQREACEASGRHVPLIVENVRGAIPWVGRSRWNFGSFHLWGDVPALMPPTIRANKVPGFRFDGSGRSFQSASVAHSGSKNNGGSWFNIGSPGQKVTGQNPDGRKNPGIELGDIGFNVASAHRFGHMVEGASYERTADDKRQHLGIKRKFASAMIAKIPLPLSRHIARVFHPKAEAA